jgi:2'-5' RNA ligase
VDLRCFIALELPKELKSDISSLTENLRDSGADVRWVPSENLHLTLKFLGNVPEEGLPGIRERVEEAAARSRSFKALLSGVGVFPGARRPRVVWIGLEDADELPALQGRIDENLRALGFQPEGRPFSPHLTIGRVRSQKGTVRLMKGLEALKDTVFGEFTAGSVSVMKSRLGPSGAKYTRLYGIPLG